MAKTLDKFISDVRTMSNEELQTLTQKIRKNKYTDKPAAKARKSKAGKSSIEKLKGSMSNEDLIRLLKE